MNFLNNIFSNQINFEAFHSYNNLIGVLSNGNLTEIMFFFENNPDIINNEFFHETHKYPIHYLFENNQFISTEIISYFIDNNCKLSYENESFSIINFLLNNNKITTNKVIDILNFLKENNFNFLSIDVNGNNIFHYLASSFHNSINIIYFFKDMEIDKNYKNAYTESPILISTRLNNTNFSLFLIEHGCDVNIVNSNNNTSLMYACMNNNGIICSKLLDYGANINFEDNQKDTPIFYASGCDNKGTSDLNLVKFLCLKGADINRKSSENFSIIHYAAGCLSQKYNIDIILFFIKLNIKYDTYDDYNMTFIDYLIKNNISKKELQSILSEIELEIPIKNSLVMSNFLENKYFKKNKVKSNTNFVCNISHLNLEENDKFYKCEYNHSFACENLLEWYKESNKYVCPLCFNLIDLSVVYEVIY